MERTITILGTIDNCKKAESLISAKLRASYESDMAQFIPVSSPLHTAIKSVNPLCSDCNLHDQVFHSSTLFFASF